MSDTLPFTPARLQRRRRRFNRLLTRAVLDRAILIDFEGRAVPGEPPAMLGVLDRLDGDWTLRQFVFDPALHMASSATGIAGTRVDATRAADIDETLEWLCRRVRDHGSKLVGWTEHDYWVLYGLRPDPGVGYRNARATVKRWARERGLPFEGDLQSNLERFGYDRPAAVVAGAASFIQTVRLRSRGRQRFADVSPGGQEAWRRLVSHNASDLWGMLHVLTCCVTSAGPATAIDRGRTT